MDFAPFIMSYVSLHFSDLNLNGYAKHKTADDSET